MPPTERQTPAPLTPYERADRDVCDALAYLNHLASDPLVDNPGAHLIILSDHVEQLEKLISDLVAAYYNVATIPATGISRYDVDVRAKIDGLADKLRDRAPRAADRSWTELPQALIDDMTAMREAVAEMVLAYRRREV